MKRPGKERILEFWQNSTSQPKQTPATAEQTIDLDSERVFADFFTETHVLVFRYIYGLNGGPQEAVEDLAAETFLRAWKSRHSFVGTYAAAIGWVLAIARNLVIDNQRQKSQQGPVEEITDDITESATPDPEMHLVLSEQQHILQGLLQELPVQQREMLVLRYILGWKVKHIADYLGVPPNTVSVNIRRALTKLRSIWPRS